MKKRFLLTITALSFFNLLIAQTTVSFRDDFDNNQNGWLEKYVAGKYETKVQNGHYYIEHLRTEGSWYFWVSKFLDPQKDYYIEAKIKQLTGTTTHGYGIVFGAANVDNSYAYIISTNKNYRISKYVKGTYQDIQKWTKCKNVNKLFEYNTLGIRKVGTEITFELNGEKLWTTGAFKLMGMNLGFVVNNNMKIAVDYILLMQDGNEINLVDHPINGYIKENLGEKVNSIYDEVSPVISQDGKTLYFCRKHAPENFGDEDKDDIWYSIRQTDSTWGSAINIGSPANNNGHNSIVSISADNNTLILKNTYKIDGTPGGEGYSETHRIKGGWELPTKIAVTNFYNNNNYSNACVSTDLNFLISAIERTDSYGDMDLYISFKEGDHYTEPKNMGSVLNTMMGDFAPFLASDNKTLYYASYGKPGYGSADIYVSRRLDDTWLNWSEPKNLGPEINTTDWDAYYTIPASGEYAYMVSSENSIGATDIFRIKQSVAAKPDPVALVYGEVINSKTKEPVPSAEIEYSDLSTSKVLGTASSDPETGKYRIVLPYGKAYSFLSSKKGFYSISENIDLTNITKYEEVNRQLYLAPIEVGEVIRLNNIFFDVAKATLKPESNAELDRLVKIMNDYPQMIIEIAGHTDSDGTEEYNLTLSNNRLKSVAEYMISKGVDVNRFTAKGYGEMQPLVPNDTDEGKAKNRRVEFRIVKM